MAGNSPQPRHSDYLDFELEIGEGQGRDYPVAILHSPAGEARETMRFPFDELALDLRLSKLQIALLRSGGKHRRAPTEEEQAVQDLGKALFDALFQGELRSCYDVSLREAAQQERGLRLKLRIRPPELNALPWEFLYDPRQAEYVCLSRQTPIVRYLESPRPIRPITVSPPLRILGMVASPQDLPPLDVEREKQRVEQAVQEMQARGLVELQWLPGQTWRDLQRATWGGPWHVFHFVGHGGFDLQADEGFVALADSTGHRHCLSATRLGRLLADISALRLVLLNSCEGARGGDRDVFSSTASILVRRGIPAVLAMQYEITDRAAVELARAFYEALAYGMAVDEAVVVARKSISLAVSNTMEWGTPVLYMRTPDGVLFQMTERPPAMAAGAVAPAPGPAPAPQVDAEQARRLEQLYLDGLDAFWVEKWEQAARCFQTVVEEQPEYRDAAARLREAQRQGELARLYAQAQAAREKGDWPGARAALEKLVAEAPDYRDAAALLEAAKKEVQLADLYAQAQQLHRAGRWQAVIKVFGQIAALAPEHPDPEGLLAVARREVEAEAQQEEVRVLYGQAGQALEAGQWAEARRLLRQVQERAPGYREAERLLARAEAEMEARAEVGAKAGAEVPGAKGERARVSRPSRASLPAWFWPAAGGIAVVLVVVIVLIATLGGGGGGAETPTQAPGATVISAASPTAGAGATAGAGTTVIADASPTAGDRSDTWTRPADGMVMVYVPAGEFTMGSTEDDVDAGGDEMPQHTVYLDAFWIDRNEVTNAHYQTCVDAGACTPSRCALEDYLNDAQQPVVCVNWDDAQVYCQWAGARLPTEAEWEKAARGTDERIYPWGDEAPDCDKANFSGCNEGTNRVGTCWAGASPYGALDMAGNALEWVADRYDLNYYARSPERNPQGPEAGPWRVLRGGSWGDAPNRLRAATRYGDTPTDSFEYWGFRCARSDSEP
jgi:formylglycine-generating enzyme required for sulfatase activity